MCRRVMRSLSAAAGLLLFLGLSVSAFSGHLAGAADVRQLVMWDEVSAGTRLLVAERASLAAVESLKTGQPPHTRLLLESGLGLERLEGAITPIYHEFGAVYVIRGGGKITFRSGGMWKVDADVDDISVVELWCTERLTFLLDKAPPPDPGAQVVTSSNRVYAGRVTVPQASRYFGVRANVEFPQYVPTSESGGFNVYTTHVTFSDATPMWFESAVGQYGWWGGADDRPNAIFWAQWLPHQIVVPMDPTLGNYKRARIETRYYPSGANEGECYMVVRDHDMLKMYSRIEIYPGKITSYVTLVQEQIAQQMVYAHWARFTSTEVHLGGLSYVNWSSTSVHDVLLLDPPMQFEWIDESNREYRTRCNY